MELENLSNKFYKTKSSEDALNLIRHCRCTDQFSLGRILGKELITLFPFCNFLKNEYAMCCYYDGDKCTSFETYQNILSSKTLNEVQSNEYLFNAHFSAECMKDAYINYNLDIVNGILNRKSTNIPLITFTITTCKRFDLFEQTINSFLNCCLDVNRIDEWICVDDNSSEKDRTQMKEKYPFFRFIFKNIDQKGHAKSMNILRENIQTPYFFHMEDDWKFYVKRNYISDCLEILNSNSTFGQCLINKNYAEVIQDRDIAGGEFHTTLSGLRYYIHEHCSTKAEYESFYAKRNSKDRKNCAYWPHYSLRPSLLKKEVLDKLGEYDVNAHHFEMDYAYKYFDAGYRSVFLEDIYCIHIGKLTSEKGENAYSLNNESQFVKNVNWKEISDERKICIYVINLDRRSDRFQKMEEEFKKENMHEYLNRYSAVDGQKLESTFQIRRLFDGNDYNWRRGIIGCALSHMILWFNLLSDPKHEEFLILEDDVELSPNFIKRFKTLLETLPQNYDILYLGHHIYEKYITDKTYSKTELPSCEKWNTFMSLRFSRGGTGGYLISKKGAEKMIDFINERGMTNGIDTMQQKAGDYINLYYSLPHLIYSECYTGTNEVDTDIQKDYDSLRMSISDRLEIELKLFRALCLKPRQINDLKEIDYFTDTVVYMTDIDVMDICVLDIKDDTYYYTLENEVLFVIIPFNMSMRMKYTLDYFRPREILKNSLGKTFRILSDETILSVIQSEQSYLKEDN